MRQLGGVYVLDTFREIECALEMDRALDPLLSELDRLGIRSFSSSFTSCCRNISVRGTEVTRDFFL